MTSPRNLPAQSKARGTSERVKCQCHALAEWNLREIFRFSHRFWRDISVKPWKTNREKDHINNEMFFSPFASLINREKNSA